VPDLKPFLVLGVALGGVFATSGVGLVVLYRTTGVLNLAYGAIGATGALISWSLLDNNVAEGVAYLACILFGGVVTLLYGMLFGPPFAARDPLVKATATLGLLLILLGTMQWIWGPDPHGITLPTTEWNYEIAGARVSGTQIIGVLFALVVAGGTSLLLRVTKVGTAMRALADDRDIAATLGVPVRRVEAAAWLGSGLVCGATGLLLSNLVGLDIVGLTFLVIPSLAAALVGQLRSVWVTLAAGFLIGIVQSTLNAFSEVAEYRNLTPFVVAIVALLWFAVRRRPTAVEQFR
jgi:branched-chain amino acid transport system permease protein